MPSLKRHLTVQTIGLVATVLLVAAAVACGSCDPDPIATASASPSSPPTATATTLPLPRIDPTSTSAPGQNPTIPSQPAVPEQGQLPVSSAAGTLFDWRVDDIDEGTKPAITVNAAGVPSVAYMLEAIDGFVKNAQLLNGSWNITTVSEGYFYGPLDVDTGADGQPRIVWHDHQSNAFQPELGDVEYAVLGTDGEWRDVFRRWARRLGHPNVHRLF